VELIQLPTFHVDHLLKTIHIFHFLVLHNWLLLHQDNHMTGINFFQTSPIQQLKNFEQLNIENMIDPPNNAKNKWKN
jgi:hypothetical protein